jgi:hypothetical protein
MIHAVYTRNTKKSKWRLFSTVVSAETATSELVAAKQQAIKEGFDEAETAIQVFDSLFYVPEYINSIKAQAPQYN